MASSAHKTALSPGDPRLIQLWARRYAKSRTIPYLVQWFFIVVMILVVGGTILLTNQAMQTGSQLLVSCSLISILLAIVALSWFSMSRAGGMLIWRITQKIYGEEGYVSDMDDAATPMPWWIMVMGGGLVVYHLLGALLISFGYLPLENLQPYSAVYMVAFLITMIIHQKLGFWAWLWPLLYWMHGLMLMSGLPLRFPSKPIYLELLNLVVPVFGYGLLSIIVGHIYSRYALGQLKRLARGDIPDMPSDITCDVEEDGKDESV
jgi:hypothetical protein